MDKKTLDESRETAIRSAKSADYYAGSDRGRDLAEIAKSHAMIYAADVARYNAETYHV